MYFPGNQSSVHDTMSISSSLHSIHSIDAQDSSNKHLPRKNSQPDTEFTEDNIYQNLPDSIEVSSQASTTIESTNSKPPPFLKPRQV